MGHPNATALHKEVARREPPAFVPDRPSLGRRYDRPMSEAEGTIQEQLDDIGVQLSWVRDYL